MKFPTSLAENRLGLTVTAVLGALFVFYAFGSWCYPLTGDDFAFAAEAEEFSFFHNIANLYAHWSCRFGNLLGYAAAKWDFLPFRILNPLWQTGAVFAAFFLLTGRFPKWRDRSDLLILLFLAPLMATAAARVRDTVFWLSGSCNYSWSFCCWMFFAGVMVHCRNYKPSIRGKTGLLISGAAMAMVLEVLLLLGVLFFILTSFSRKLRTPARLWGGAGYGIGSILYLASPGLWNRAGGAVLPLFDLCGKLELIPEILIFWGAACWPMIVLGALLFCLDFPQERKAYQARPWFFAWWGASLVTALFFGALGSTPALRGYYASSLFALLADAAGLRRLMEKGKTVRLLPYLTAGISFAVLLAAVPDFCSIWSDQQLRDRLIAEAKSKGETMVTVPAHRIQRRNFFQYIYVEDIHSDPEFWVNRLAARYYRLHKISATDSAPLPRFWVKR